MSIFSKENIDNVQELIKNPNGRSGNGHSKDPENKQPDEQQQQSQRMQELIQALNDLPDLKARELAQQCIQEMLTFYGNGLERILQIILQRNNNEATNIFNKLIEDNFISSLLLIHDLHPLDLKTRLNMALDKVRPYIDSHGGKVEIVQLRNGIAKIRFSGSCKGCPSSGSTLELGIKQAIDELCPDLLGLEVEGITDMADAPSKNGNSKQYVAQGWHAVNTANQIKNDSMKSATVSGMPILICKVADELYAYHNECPACAMPLNTGTLEKNFVSCKLGHRYDVKHAGKCVNDEELHLTPYPLMEDQGIIKIAIG